MILTDNVAYFSIRTQIMGIHQTHHVKVCLNLHFKIYKKKMMKIIIQLSLNTHLN